jgi:hypothetical protein
MAMFFLPFVDGSIGHQYAPKGLSCQIVFLLYNVTALGYAFHMATRQTPEEHAIAWLTSLTADDLAVAVDRINWYLRGRFAYEGGSSLQLTTPPKRKVGRPRKVAETPLLAEVAK